MSKSGIMDRIRRFYNSFEQASAIKDKACFEMVSKQALAFFLALQNKCAAKNLSLQTTALRTAHLQLNGIALHNHTSLKSIKPICYIYNIVYRQICQSFFHKNKKNHSPIKGKNAEHTHRPLHEIHLAKGRHSRGCRLAGIEKQTDVCHNFRLFFRIDFRNAPITWIGKAPH